VDKSCNHSEKWPTITSVNLYESKAKIVTLTCGATIIFQQMINAGGPSESLKLEKFIAVHKFTTGVLLLPFFVNSDRPIPIYAHCIIDFIKSHYRAEFSFANKMEYHYSFARRLIKSNGFEKETEP
jgi:hypothetical protein